MQNEASPIDYPGSSSCDESEDNLIMYVPDCDESLKPMIGRSFLTMEEGVSFYRAYGADCGFGIRKSTIKRASDGSIILGYILCSRAGKYNLLVEESHDKAVGASRKRKTSSCRTECKAMIGLRFEAGVGYSIYKFEAAHNHDMVSPGYRQQMKVNKKIDYGHYMFLGKCAKANVGASRAFHIFKQMVGSSEKVGVRKNDFKNMYRDIKIKTDGFDSDMLLEKFQRLSQKNKGFFYAYFEDENKVVSRLFWADYAAIENFKIFGDAISFDATYSTNKYCMVFTPFTGRDNHCRCVNLGAGLIAHENAESYSWLLSKFVECMGSAPKMLITDQDRGIKVAVETVLPNTRHRLCMWHIMNKLGDKLPHSLRDSDGFTQQFTELVWSDSYDVEHFEAKWHDIMEEFNLHGHKWFGSMYQIRSSWIPAYFKDVEMSGLFLTTSISESDNSFFRRYTNKHANLRELFMHFELAIETQRDDHDRRSLHDQSTSPRLLTKLKIEEYASTVYTNETFLEVQKEIEIALTFCTVQDKVTSSDQVIYVVDEDALGLFKVVYNVSDAFMTCSCKFFYIKGLVCKHMFAVMLNRKDKTIADAYVVHRWTKKACSIFEDLGQNMYASGGVRDASMGDAMFALACKCVGLASGNDEISTDLELVLNDFYNKYVNEVLPVSSAEGKHWVVEQYYGSLIPEESCHGQPKVSVTKGSCSRLISRIEAAKRKSEKPKRLCRYCGQMGYHDSRNCPLKKKSQS